MKKILAYLLLSATTFGFDINQEVQKDISKTNILERKPVDRTYVQILSSESANGLQSLINDFITGKEIVDIQFQTTIQGNLKNSLNYPVYSVLIIYKY